MARPQTAPSDPLVPRPWRVIDRTSELNDVTTLRVQPINKSPVEAKPGQFAMLYVFGIGEIAISISAIDAKDGSLLHTIRDVGAVSRALTQMEPDSQLGWRGPFGIGWPLQEAEGRDVVLVAGGLGLAPLRPAIAALRARRERFRRISILIGCRTPEDLFFLQDIEDWRGRPDIDLDVTVDHGDAGWLGHVGVVPTLISRAAFDPENCVAFVCGPEIMMRFSAQALLGEGVGPARIYLSMERNMKCALGHCGRCQFGPTFVCKDGPVLPLERISSIFATREI